MAELPPTSWASSDAARRSMKSNRRRDTGPELRLRSALHRLGYRFRVDTRPLPEVNRRADIVFAKRRVAVFVHGCYWHGCQQHYTAPKANAEFWADKVAANRARDSETRTLLSAAGWRVVVVWEHETVEEAVGRIARAIGEADSDSSNARQSPARVGVFRAVSSRDGAALERDGHRFIASNKVEQVAEGIPTVYEIQFDDGRWMLADERDLKFDY